MPRRRPSSYHHGELGPALIAQARRAVVRDGHERVSLRAIAAATGVSHVAAVHHFGNREGVLAAVATAALGEITDALRVAGSHADPRRAFRAVGDAYLAWALAHPALYRLTFAAGGWRTVEHAAMTAGVAALVEVVAGVLRRGQLAGVHRAGSPADLALYAWSAVHGASLVALDNPQLVGDLAADGDRLRTLVLDGIFSGVAAPVTTPARPARRRGPRPR